jgi:ABC-type phosphate transport system substrate-binding protein
MTRRALRLAVLVLLVLGLASTSIAAEEGFKIIVNPANSIDAVDRDLLRDAYLKKATEWRGGATIHPIDLSKKFTVRTKFVEHVVRKTPAQLKRYWSQQIFSGKGVPPPEADSTDDVVEYVLANKGAVGYLPASADPGKAKVIGIR